MSDDTPSLDQQIADIETTLRQPNLPASVRQLLTGQLHGLHQERASVERRTAHTGGGDHAERDIDKRSGAFFRDSTVYGPVVGVNQGVIQAFFGAKPPEDAKELLDSYLSALITTHDALRVGRLLGRQQTGRECSTAPDLSLCAVYTSLITDVRTRGDDWIMTVEELRAAVDSADPNQHLPERLQLPLLRASAMSGAVYGPDGVTLAAQWASLRRFVAEGAPDEVMTGAWHRPELVVEAVARVPRLVLLGGPGSGKSTVLRYLVVSLAEALRAGSTADIPGWVDMQPPVPLFCALGPVARALGDDPDDDVEVLIAHLLKPVLGPGAIRADLRQTVVRAWRGGGALICLDGLDEASGVDEPTRAGRLSRRARLVEAIRVLAGQIGATRVVVTCRTQPYRESVRWQLGGGWATRVIEPFCLSQVQHYIRAWYAQLAQGDAPVLDADAAARRAADLVAAIPQKVGLRDIVATPLLLTMVALLHFNEERELPDERAEIYEKLVELLLERWERLRSAGGGAEQRFDERLETPGLRPVDLRPVIHEVAATAHAQQVDGSGIIPRGDLERRLRTLFRQWLNPDHPEGVADDEVARRSARLLRLLLDETGLIQPDGDETFRLPHLTFEEYLAACHLAVLSTGEAHRRWRDGGDRWREPILLLMGRWRMQDKYDQIDAWLRLLLAPDGKDNVQAQRDALLAADCYADVGRRRMLSSASLRASQVTETTKQLRRRLAELLADRTQPLPTSDRVRAGFALGDLGDPRIPVTEEDWQRELAQVRANDTSGYFCRVAPGTYWVGSADDDPEAQDVEKPRHQITLDQPLWIARYPVTNAQWQAWVEQGGQPSYDADNTDLNHPNQPVVAVTWDMVVAYCAWLSKQLGAEVRLPREVEWEAAARGLEGRRYPWGDEWRDDHAATEEDRTARGWRWSVPVGCYPAGAAACGALDMAGNVWEWTADVWELYPGAEKRFTDEVCRVVRGGGYADERTSVRCAARNWSHRDNLLINGGFRVVVSPPLARSC